MSTTTNNMGITSDLQLNSSDNNTSEETVEKAKTIKAKFFRIMMNDKSRETFMIGIGIVVFVMVVLFIVISTKTDDKTIKNMAIAGAVSMFVLPVLLIFGVAGMAVGERSSELAQSAAHATAAAASSAAAAANRRKLKMNFPIDRRRLKAKKSSIRNKIMSFKVEKKELDEKTKEEIKAFKEEMKNMLEKYNVANSEKINSILIQILQDVKYAENATPEKLNQQIKKEEEEEEKEATFGLIEQ